MSNLVASIVVLAFAAAALGGCLDGPADPAGSIVPPVSTARTELLDVLAQIPALDYDAMKGVTWWENFVNGNSLRQWPLPTNMLASTYLENELRAAGFQARTMYVTPPTAAGPGTITNGPAGYRVVQGLKEGTVEKDHRLVLIAHYDTVFTTKQGAYDDGSGTAAEMEICKLLAKVPTNKTIECVFFDNEEAGLTASRAYADWYAQTKPPFVWDQAFGYDMTGLNWPGYSKWKLYAMIGNPTTHPKENIESNAAFLDIVNYEFLRGLYNVTADGVEVLRVHDRNSDEQSFKAKGIPVIRYAGGRKAADYPQYHQPDDTVEFVYRYACTCDDLAKGKKAFADGFGMVVINSYYTILAYDKYDPEKLPF